MMLHYKNYTVYYTDEIILADVCYTTYITYHYISEVKLRKLCYIRNIIFTLH